LPQALFLCEGSGSATNMTHNKEHLYNTGGRRLVAAVVDVMAIRMAIPVILAIIPLWSVRWVVWAILELSIAAYFVVLHARKGATLGKWLSGVVVRDYATLGCPTMRQCLRREAPLVAALFAEVFLAAYYTFISGAVLEDQAPILLHVLGWSLTIWLAIEIATMFLDSRRRAVHDYLGHTIVQCV